MITYVARRLLLFFPTLVVISLLAFIISVNAPGDPVERMISVSAGDGISTQSHNQYEQEKYWRKKLGLDLPVFYFSLTPLSEPDITLSIYDERERESVQRLSVLTGNSYTTAALHQARIKLAKCMLQQSSVLSDSLRNILVYKSNQLKYASTISELQSGIAGINVLMKGRQEIKDDVKQALDQTSKTFNSWKQNTTSYKNYIPIIHLHSKNQYHRWLFGDGNWLTGSGSVHSKGIIRGDFGISYQTRQPVSEVILQKAGWSMFFALLSVFLAYVISIPIGVWAGASKNSVFDKSSSLILFLLYSMPSFWVATLLLMTFANPDALHWFPASGIKPVTGYTEGGSIFEKLRLSLPYLILPLICYTYSSFAFLSRAMRVAVLETMSQDYIRTAMAKGLPFTTVVFKHAFRNSLLPLITVFANIFPLALGGSVILETIFTIPGMGYETVQSIQNQNYPMIVAIFTITGLLTMIGYLVSDILYAFADPRITFTHKRS
ncbi:MAG TPA: ABC transporter permease [Bacteroidia bacterium]|nr:ABC transporter permease [Bacteroidia bacterium]